MRRHSWKWGNKLIKTERGQDQRRLRCGRSGRFRNDANEHRHRPSSMYGGGRGARTEAAGDEKAESSMGFVRKGLRYQVRPSPSATSHPGEDRLPLRHAAANQSRDRATPYDRPVRLRAASTRCCGPVTATTCESSIPGSWYLRRPDVHWSFDTSATTVALLNVPRGRDELVIASELLLRSYGLDEPLPSRSRCMPEPIQYATTRTTRSISAPYSRSTGRKEPRPDCRGMGRGRCSRIPRRQPCQSCSTPSATQRTRAFVYRRREARGGAGPPAAGHCGGQSGTCRDFAFLFMEAARSLGFRRPVRDGLSLRPASDRRKGAAALRRGATPCPGPTCSPPAPDGSSSTRRTDRRRPKPDPGRGHAARPPRRFP